MLKPKFWNKSKLSLISILLIPFSIIYQILFFFKRFFVQKNSFDIPIVCIGNIYLGGTGKTPLSIKMYEILKKMKMKPVVVRKKYKYQNDEVSLIKKYCKIILSNNRPNGINEAIKKRFNVVILDDGYQDYSIQKKINFVTFNLNQKIGNGLILPAGPLRQRLNYLNECSLVFLNGKRDIKFEKKLKKYNPDLKFIYYKYFSNNLKYFKKKKLIAFAGIGNPENFFTFLKKNGIKAIKTLDYPDHYNYSNKDIDRLLKLKKKYSAKLVTTEKDYLRIDNVYRKYFDYIKINTILYNQNILNRILKKI